jgi:hypothetical protein
MTPAPTQANVPSTVVRLPWPDELPRLADAFPGLNSTGPRHLRVLVVVPEANHPERLVGLAALAEPAPGTTTATLLLRIRARFTDTAAADALLAEAKLVAVGLGVCGLSTTRIAGSDPREPVLRRAGFTAADEGKTWHLELG